MQIDVDKLEKSLVKKGFVKDKTHHKLFRHQYRGKFTSIMTKISHSAKSYSNDLVGVVKRQMKFNSPQELRDFVSCTLSLDEYNDILIAKGEFPR